MAYFNGDDGFALLNKQMAIAQNIIKDVNKGATITSNIAAAKKAEVSWKDQNAVTIEQEPAKYRERLYSAGNIKGAALTYDEIKRIEKIVDDQAALQAYMLKQVSDNKANAGKVDVQPGYEPPVIPNSTPSGVPQNTPQGTSYVDPSTGVPTSSAVQPMPLMPVIIGAGALIAIILLVKKD